MTGTDRCLWHPRDEAARQRHREASAKGGLAKAYNAIPSTDAIDSDAKYAALDLETAAGLKSFLAATLRRLATLPMDTRLAHAVAAIVNAQRSTLETADFEARLAALEERAAAPSLRRA